MSGQKLRGGMVTTIRINPTDCMSILDVIDTVGVRQPGMSFAQQVSLTLSALLETARVDGLIPRPDEFEYLNRLGPYIDGKNNKRKQAMTEAINGAGGRVKVGSLQRPNRSEALQEAIESPVVTTFDEPPQTADQREAARELTELLQKKDMAEEGVQGIVWGSSDQQRYETLVNIVYGG